MTTTADAEDSGFRRRLAGITALAALWRLAILIVDKWDQPLIFNDSWYYSWWARGLTHGRYFQELFLDRPTAEHGPLTSVLLAPLSWMDNATPWQRLGTVATGVATVWLLGILGRRIAGRRAGLIAAAIAAISPNLWMNDGLVMSESISILLVTAVLLVGWRVIGARRQAPSERGGGDGPPGEVVWTGARAARLVVLLGVLCGLATLARTELGLLFPLIGLGTVVFRPVGTPAAGALVRWKSLLAFAAAGAVVLLPWVGANLVRFEQPVLLSTNDGSTLLGSYCDGSFSGRNLGGWTMECVLDHPRYTLDEDASLRSGWQRREALAYLGDHLGSLPKVVAARLARTADLYGLEAMVQSDVGDERYRWASWAGIVSWWVLAPLAVFGLRRLDRAALRLLLAPVAVVVVSTVVFYGGHRIRSTLEPVVVIGAAVFLAGLAERRSAARSEPAQG